MTEVSQNPNRPEQSEKDKAEQNTAAAEANAPTSDQPNLKLEQKITELAGQVKEKEDKYLYLYADFDNFKKRSARERLDLLKFGWEPLARDLLSVLDNLERAMAHVPENIDKNWLKGIDMVQGQLRAALEKQGIQFIVAQENPFDPNFHEAVGQEASKLPAGTIVREESRGYTLHGRLLRPSRVVISAGQPEKSS